VRAYQKSPDLNGLAIQVVTQGFPGSKPAKQNEPKMEELPSVVRTRSGYGVSAQAKSDGDGNDK
jgi:hypothetical protein